jgi:hypothetical protein
MGRRSPEEPVRRGQEGGEPGLGIPAKRELSEREKNLLGFLRGQSGMLSLDDAIELARLEALQGESRGSRERERPTK